MATELGILSFGAYLPRARLQRKAIHAANAWFNPGLRGLAKGERAMANWDEDAITMAVEAARDCLSGVQENPAALVLASTTLPFDDRLNAGVVASALALPTGLRAADAAGSLRAGTSALATAFAAAGAGRSLVVGADHRRTRAASAQEMQYGDGAAALLVGQGTPVARLIGSHTETVDFVHQFRQHGRDSDYAWEERWIRDEGYMKIVPRAVGEALKAAGVDPASVAHFCMPCTLSRVGAGVAKRIGIPEGAVRDTLAGVCGDTGAAHPLLMLVHALQQAKPGERVVVAAFGEGCDTLVFEATDAIASLAPRQGALGALAARREEGNYLKFLSFNDVIDLERGMRAEVDKGTPLSLLYRNREMVQGLNGGKCRKCGTLQFPKGRYCVNPECKALDSQDDQRFADLSGKVMSYTADLLTYSADPPAYYGMLVFDQGGRMLADFTEVEPGKIGVGTPMRMVFRIKDVDAARGFVRYFWKATPAV